MFFRILILCLLAAMICVLIRVQRPEIAMAVSLAASVAAVILLWNEYKDEKWLQTINDIFALDKDIYGSMLKAAGIGILSEMCAQICHDAGENAIAGRIGLASRIAMIGICGPMLIELLNLFEEVLP